MLHKRKLLMRYQITHSLSCMHETFELPSFNIHDNTRDGRDPIARWQTLSDAACVLKQQNNLNLLNWTKLRVISQFQSQTTFLFATVFIIKLLEKLVVPEGRRKSVNSLHQAQKSATKQNVHCVGRYLSKSSFSLKWVVDTCENKTKLPMSKVFSTYSLRPSIEILASTYIECCFNVQSPARKNKNRA